MLTNNSEKLMRMTIDVPVNFHRLIKSTASMQGKTIRDFTINALMEQIEDQIDLQDGLKALAEFEAGDKKTYSLEEIKRENNIE